MEIEKKATVEWKDQEINVVIIYKEIDTSFVDSESEYYRNYIRQTELELVDVTVSEMELGWLSKFDQVLFSKWLEDKKEDIFYEHVVND